MKPSELLRLVWINITQNKFKTIMTSIGIIVGAATIVMVIAIGKGGQEDVADQFKNLNAGAIDISYDGGDKNRGGNQSSDDSSDSGMMMMPSGSGAPSGSSSSGGSSLSLTFTQDAVHVTIYFYPVDLREDLRAVATLPAVDRRVAPKVEMVVTEAACRVTWVASLAAAVIWKTA